MSIEDKHISRSRRSASADAALRAELERIERMSIEQRIIAALTMRERFEWCQAVKVNDEK